MDDREFEIFEVCPDEKLKWHASALGVERALDKLDQLRAETLNECFAAYTRTLKVIGSVSKSRALTKILADNGFTN